MRNELPIVYIVDAAVAVTGALIAARHIARLLQGSAQVVLVLPHGHRIAAEDLGDFWRVDTLPIVSISKNLSAMLRYVPALLVSAWMLKQRMHKDGATRLQLNDFFLLHGAVLRLLGFSGHIVSWVRCDPLRFAGPLARPILALAGWSANRRVAVSRFIQSRLPANYSTDIMYDCSMGTALPRAAASPEKNLVYIGNYIRGKGQDMALAAFAIAAAQDTTLRLHFYGGDMGLAKNRAYREELATTAKRSACADRIAFHDFVSNTAPILQTAYASLNFSICESFSMTVLEASGAGVPVIATACGGPEEIIVDGVTGYLVPVGDAETAAARIITLAQNPETAAAMGKAGAAHIAAHFSAATFTEKLRDVLSLQSA
jgi:glycosyltransferase involved in cell wall biosynthesis